MLKTIIIDDEPDCVKLLALQLKMYCPQVVVIGDYTDPVEGLKGIRSLQPDLVFLDIEMPRMNGFDLLQQAGPLPFSIVFVTAYDRFAVKAFRFSALDYLLKPVDAHDLMEAVKKAKYRPKMAQQIDVLKQHISLKQHAGLPDKIALPFQNGVTFTELSSIIYCVSHNNYTKFHLVNGQTLTASKTLADVQEMLEQGNFLRVHRQYIVNLDHIKKYIRSDNNCIILADGTEIPVARNQKERLMARFGWL